MIWYSILIKYIIILHCGYYVILWQTSCHWFIWKQWYVISYHVMSGRDRYEWNDEEIVYFPYNSSMSMITTWARASDVIYSYGSIMMVTFGSNVWYLWHFLAYNAHHVDLGELLLTYEQFMIYSLSSRKTRNNHCPRQLEVSVFTTPWKACFYAVFKWVWRKIREKYPTQWWIICRVP